MKPILIGMNNPVSLRAGHELYPLPEGCTGNRIYKMLKNTCREVTMRNYCDAFERRNLVIAALFDKLVALDRAQKIEQELFGSRRTVVLLGEAVRKAFNVPPVLIEPRMIGGIVFRQIPHPSGRNPWYNDQKNCEQVGKMLAQLYEESVRENA